MRGDPVVIAVIAEWFSEKMGYAENCLPKAFARLGHEVHVVTSDAQVYFDSPDYAQTYEPFIGPPVVPCEVKALDGYTLHRLRHARVAGRIRIPGLLRKLREVRADVVQTFEVDCPTTRAAALGRVLLGYRLFLESHVHASVFGEQPRGTWRERLGLPSRAKVRGRLVSLVSERCYPISSDAAEIAIRHLGVEERKVNVVSLGVDTERFAPARDASSREERERARARLGYGPSDIVCVYSGRFSKGKDPLCLARAIDRLLSSGEPFRGLFVGNGAAHEVAAIRGCAGCLVHPFVPVHELPALYRAADIGVWPRQESTSQLDAAACGLPIVISDRAQVTERVDGNGATYSEGDPADLARVLLTMTDGRERRRLGAAGAEKMERSFSWNSIARGRLEDYAESLKARRR